VLVDHHLRSPQPEEAPEDVRTVARTLTMLSRLDGSRKGSIVQFLRESGLIHKDKPVLQLDNADLRGTDLSETYLEEVNLSLTDLRESDLKATLLTDTDLRGANLKAADLRGTSLYGAKVGYYFFRDRITASVIATEEIPTNLTDADLREAHLEGASLSHANLSGAKGVTNEELDQQAASLEGATMPNDQKYEDWLKSKGRGEVEENH
jgi:uncharacterized protein YjbI with pentapeptide repeats